MAISRKTLRENVRNSYMEKVVNFLKENDEEILVTASNEIAFPIVDSEGNDDFVVIKFSIPTGTRDGEAYDGYAVAKDYELHKAEMEEKAKAQAEAKAKKLAKAKAEKEAKAKAKADHEAEKAKAEKANAEA